MEKNWTLSLQTFENYLYAIKTIVFSPDDQFLIFISYNNIVKL